MDKYVCSVCGYVYDPQQGDPDNGIDPGTKFEDLPGDWGCPVCGASKDDFEVESQFKSIRKRIWTLRLNEMLVPFSVLKNASDLKGH